MFNKIKRWFKGLFSYVEDKVDYVEEKISRIDDEIKEFINGAEDKFDLFKFSQGYSLLKKIVRIREKIVHIEDELRRYLNHKAFCDPETFGDLSKYQFPLLDEEPAKE